MQPIFRHLEGLSAPTHRGWFDKTDVRLKVEHQSVCTELRIMHLTIVLFSILTATFAFSLTATGLLVPITSGHVVSGCFKIVVGGGLGFLAYDLNNLREIVYKTRVIFDEHMLLNKRKMITREVQQRWVTQTELLKNSYTNNLYVMSQLLEFVWPASIPSPSET